MTLFSCLRPCLHWLSPEAVHRLGMVALSHGLLPPAADFYDPALAVTVWGLDVSNPVGLAAGFDKNAAAVDALLRQGFGFVETGTVTPRPQPGNPQPRLFRLTEDEAVINRLGFNNDGLQAYVRHMARHDKRLGIVGANIGKNKDSDDALADYSQAMRAVWPLADYITINISSPNTPGLRDLQKREALDALLSGLAAVRDDCKHALQRAVPVLLKVAPDLVPQEKEAIAELALAHRMDGMVISNTTLARPSLKSAYATEQGGLSGRPLFALSTQTLADFYRLTDGKIPLVGVGGVSSAEDAYAKIRAGATLVQLYTALVYQGFGVVRRIQKGLAALLRRDGFAHITHAVGVDNR